jgi:uroporphyrinogen III methyltransferase/synthase
MPVIKIEEMPDHGELDGVILDLSHYDWVIFTSANGVESFFTRLGEHGMDARAFGDAKICAIGPATDAGLGRYGLKADYMPTEYTSEAVAAGLKDKDIRGKRVLLPRSEIAPPELVDKLTSLGAEVKQVSAYTIVAATEVVSPGKQMLLEGKIDIVTFTSSSTVRNLVSLLGEDRQVLDRITIACIGPVTAATAVELGLKVDIEAGEHTIPGLVDAIMQKYSSDRGGDQSG